MRHFLRLEGRRRCANKHLSIVKWHVRIPGPLDPQERQTSEVLAGWRDSGCIVRNVCEVGREV